MLTRWRSGFGSVVVVLVMLGLVIGDLTDGGLRRWWAGHALTTDTVAGLLGVLVPVLGVDQGVSMRQVRGRARGIGATAAVMPGPAPPSSRAGSAARER